MAFSAYRNSDNVVPYYVELVADTNADVATIPTDFAPGSTCLVIEDFSIYILGNDLKWHKS